MMTYLFGVILSGIIWYIIVRKMDGTGTLSDLVIWSILAAISWVGVGLAIATLGAVRISNLLRQKKDK
jgi:hypothetical protein